uniref:Uncharacterized protein n=1 Tax=Sphaerodactylus townsendi TaxID=933632 RepID=A0ACB8F3D5_9SAUR
MHHSGGLVAMPPVTVASAQRWGNPFDVCCSVGGAAMPPGACTLNLVLGNPLLCTTQAAGQTPPSDHGINLALGEPISPAGQWPWTGQFHGVLAPVYGPQHRALSITLCSHLQLGSIYGLVVVAGQPPFGRQRHALGIAATTTVGHLVAPRHTACSCHPAGESNLSETRRKQLLHDRLSSLGGRALAPAGYHNLLVAAVGKTRVVRSQSARLQASQEPAAMGQ